MNIRALPATEIPQTRRNFLEKMAVYYLPVVIASQTACCLAFLLPFKRKQKVWHMGLPCYTLGWGHSQTPPQPNKGLLWSLHVTRNSDEGVE